MKVVKPWLSRILEFSLVRVSQALALGLHEGGFGLQPTTFSVDENSTWLDRDCRGGGVRAKS